MRSSIAVIVAFALSLYSPALAKPLRIISKGDVAHHVTRAATVTGNPTFPIGSSARVPSKREPGVSKSFHPTKRYSSGTKNQDRLPDSSTAYGNNEINNTSTSNYTSSQVAANATSTSTATSNSTATSSALPDSSSAASPLNPYDIQPTASTASNPPSPYQTSTQSQYQQTNGRTPGYNDQGSPSFHGFFNAGEFDPEFLSNLGRLFSREIASLEAREESFLQSHRRDNHIDMSVVSKLIGAIIGRDMMRRDSSISLSSRENVERRFTSKDQLERLLGLSLVSRAYEEALKRDLESLE